MNKRLDEIINDLPYSIRHDGSLDDLVEYAKEQADLVTELEKENERLRAENGLLWEGNARYRDVLGEVANQEIMTRTVTTNEVRLVLLARQALAGDSNE